MSFQTTWKAIDTMHFDAIQNPLKFTPTGYEVNILGRVRTLSDLEMTGASG